MTYAIQDGPDFYIFDGDDDEPADVIHAPFAFNDGDVTEARAARDWFRAQRPDVEVR